jgi:hypothetical protein
MDYAKDIIPKRSGARLKLIQKQKENIEQELGRGQGGMFIFGHSPSRKRAEE